MNDLADNNFNPWFSIWTKPRATIRKIVETDPSYRVFILVGIAGIANALDRASARSLGDHLDWPYVVLMAAVMGPIIGIIGLYIAGALIRWTGQWLGGKAPLEHIYAAIAWSSVPIVFGLALWIPELIIFREELFTEETPRIAENLTLAYLLLGFIAIELVIAIWALVIFLKALGEVQHFSAWKALANVVLAFLAIFIPIFIVVILLL